MDLHKLLYNAFATVGNTLAPLKPHGPSGTSKTPTRGAIPDLLAQKFYQPPQVQAQVPVKKPMQQVKGTQITPTPTEAYNPRVFSEGQIRKGLLAYNPNTPLASQSAVLHQAMQILAQNPKIDPFIAIAKALAESGAGRDLRHPTRQLGAAYEGVNNPLNVRDTTRPGKFVNYPDIKTAYLGGYNPYYGQESQGFVNMILNSPAYSKYRQTGNLNDFNAVYTPQSDNNAPSPAISNQMESFRRLFQ